MSTAVTALHPKVAEGASAMLNEAQARGLAVGVFMGVRNAEKQNGLYALGRTVKNPDGYDPVKKPMGNIITNAQAWMSWHSYGLAVDFAFKNSKGEWWWPPDNNPKWDDLGVLGKAFGFEWGGDWTKFPDLPHFQMRGKIPSIAQAKKLVLEQGIEAVWKLV